MKRHEPLQVGQFQVFGRPVPQGSKRAFMPKNGKRPIVVEQADQRHKDWRSAVRSAAVESLPEGWRTDGLYVVRLEFWFKRPETHYGSKGGERYIKPAAPVYVPSTPDVDKLQRAVLDSLTDAAWWADDSRVIDLRGLKVYVDLYSGDREGVHVHVRRLSPTAEEAGGGLSGSMVAGKLA